MNFQVALSGAVFSMLRSNSFPPAINILVIQLNILVLSRFSRCIHLFFCLQNDVFHSNASAHNRTYKNVD